MIGKASDESFIQKTKSMSELGHLVLLDVSPSPLWDVGASKMPKWGVSSQLGTVGTLKPIWSHPGLAPLNSR